MKYTTMKYAIKVQDANLWIHNFAAIDQTEHNKTKTIEGFEIISEPTYHSLNDAARITEKAINTYGLMVYLIPEILYTEEEE